MNSWILMLVAMGLWAALVFQEAVRGLFDRVRNFVRAEGESAKQLEQRAELALHAAFYGSAVAVWLGFGHDSVQSILVAATWAVSCIWYARRLNARVEDMEEHEYRVRWRKTAGMIRDIVKTEVAKAMKANDDQSSDCK